MKMKSYHTLVWKEIMEQKIVSALMIIQFHAPKRNEAAGIRQPSIPLQKLRLLIRQLDKCRIAVSANGNCLLLPHGGKHPNGLPDCRRHQ